MFDDHEQVSASQVLLATAYGDEDEVKRLLAISVGNLIRKGDVEDFSGRIFKNISPFQYAIWALDWNMWEMMLSLVDSFEKNVFPVQEATLPPNTIKQNDIVSIRTELLKQYKEVLENGLDYTIGGCLISGQKYFDLSVLIDALSALKRDNCNFEHSKFLRDFKTIVGQAQREVPAHIAQHYCEAVEFNEKKNFHNLNFSRSFKFYDWSNGCTRTWFPLDQSYVYGSTLLSVLGRDYAISRIVGIRNYAGFTDESARLSCEQDRDALAALYETRIKDFAALEFRLKKDLQITHELQKLKEDTYNLQKNYDNPYWFFSSLFHSNYEERIKDIHIIKTIVTSCLSQVDHYELYSLECCVSIIKGIYLLEALKIADQYNFLDPKGSILFSLILKALNINSLKEISSPDVYAHLVNLNKYLALSSDDKLMQSPEIESVKRELRDKIAAFNISEISKTVPTIDLNKINSANCTPLYLAVLQRWNRVVTELSIFPEVDFNKPGIHGYTPIGAAAYKGFDEIVDTLAKHENVDLNKPDNLGFTPFGCAASAGHLNIIKKFLELAELNKINPNAVSTKSFVNINQTNLRNSTALFLAAQNGHKSIVQLLIENKADLTICLKSSHDNLSKFGEKQGFIIQQRLEDFISKHEADPDGLYHLRPSDIASIMGHIDIVELLKSAEQVETTSPLSSQSFFKDSSEGVTDTQIQNRNCSLLFQYRKPWNMLN